MGPRFDPRTTIEAVLSQMLNQARDTFTILGVIVLIQLSWDNEHSRALRVRTLSMGFISTTVERSNNPLAPGATGLDSISKTHLGSQDVALVQTAGQ